MIKPKESGVYSKKQGKNLKNEKLLKINYKLYKFTLFITCAFFVDIYAQSIDEPKEMDFFIVDTIQISNSLVISEPGRIGEYLIDLDKTTLGKLTRNKLLNNEGVYIYDESLNLYLGYKNFQKNFSRVPYKDGESGCYLIDFESNKRARSNRVRKFEKEPRNYILALIRCDYFNDKNITYGLKESLLKDVDVGLYYKMVFPICD